MNKAAAAVHTYGYTNGQLFETFVPALPAEITLNATYSELRAVSNLSHDCADEMDGMGSEYDHVHLSDRMKGFETSPHFVVVRGQEGSL